MSQVGVSADGRINAVLLDYYHDGGFTPERFCYPLSARTLTIMDNGILVALCLYFNVIYLMLICRCSYS